ncbi:hypothetical protein [Metapseudomonas resinovorans]|uniref:Uncharacterized protein n=1 Tax=Metapseudomonas resinovorans NBRC 106553 TaxID=1245471 RepID=S6AM10_METRE|nr:hypothetical protein [Pseudomonas resinovorans]BAN46468.1 hypothetical protein PCA10_07360 [Pseudomonas resinovorans NBRC 106553]
MNTYSKPNATSGTAKTVDPAQNTGPNSTSPTATQPERMPDPEARAREAAQKGVPRDKVAGKGKDAPAESGKS